MNRSYRILPVYTADVSGVCSALYELGGMVVMHDPSGCNSTYNTHDETRWYDRDSLIFISGLTERDAILGNDRKFMDAVAESAARFHPRFVALAGSPIPYMNGTDFPALARLLEQRAGLPCFAIPTNGMHDYFSGRAGARRGWPACSYPPAAG
ncbi:MAG: nitrogenase component 1, partial [Oscillospiraceae bacterium]|nr:nitrogenase component 1 [Oscillospiraceae bacterium]